MRLKSYDRLVRCALALALLSSVPVGAAAQQKPSDAAKEQAEARKQAEKAAKVFREIMSVPDKAIPRELLQNAEAVAVFPDVIKAGVILVGGRGGRGVISRRIRGGWSAPAFFKIGGGSFGPQIGASSTDFVLIFMNEAGVKGLLEDKLELGGEVSVAAGPFGRATGASTNATLDAGILTYSRSKGVFVGAELKGVVIDPDNKRNEAVYGLTARDLLVGVEVKRPIPSAVRSLTLQLARYSRK
ncbi:MAG TPA: lipid-binding SYLF domain-containing protein [Pyrinomonadaceae bacterium]